MQGTEWVNTNMALPDDDEPVLLISDGEILAGVYRLEWNSVEGEMQWFLDDAVLPLPIPDADYWMYLRDLPMPEGEW
ncbi:hypothetical protein AB6F89_15455 [Providencia hangzhouensis]|uniref:hypothetical protein n=1 Tax=Providencia hangzhouensis TaxID=3031799 RepID=UPI0034DCEA50